MNKFRFEWIQEWCESNGWSDPFCESQGYWAFPPCAVMPLPIPNDALELIKSEKGLSPQERHWGAIAWGTTVLAAASGYYLASPMPLIAAFAFCAFVVAAMDNE